MWFVLACAPPPPVVTAPAAHSWAQEGELVVSGLHDAERMWTAGQRGAARTAAERVYTERWEPHLEGALRQTKGPLAVAAVEYSFGQVLVEMEGYSREKVTARVDAVNARVREVAVEAGAAFPPPGTAVTAPVPIPREGVKALTPDVAPNWEQGEQAPAGEADPP